MIRLDSTRPGCKSSQVDSSSTLVRWKWSTSFTSSISHSRLRYRPLDTNPEWRFWSIQEKLYLNLGLESKFELNQSLKRRHVELGFLLSLSLGWTLAGAGARNIDQDQDRAGDEDGNETDLNCEVSMSKSYLALPYHTWPDLTWSSLTTPNRTDKSGLIVLSYSPFVIRQKVRLKVR